MSYRSAARSFQRGFVQGQRAGEFEQLQGFREREEGRRQKRHEWEKEDREKQKKFEVVKQEVNTAKAMMDAGDERGAAKKVVDLYNEQYPNGDEVRIIFKSDSPNDDRWNTDPNLRGKDIAVLSKSGGMLPYKNMKDLMKFVASSLKYEQFSKDMDAVSARVADANTQSKPFKADDGKMYIQRFKEGPGGSIIKDGDPVPYSGKAPLAGGLKQASESGLDTSKLSRKDKEILAGIRVKKKDPEALKLGDRSKAAKLQSEVFAKDLNIVLKPFSKPGRMVINLESGEITDEGQNALDAALNLFQKYKDKKELTPQERKKLSSARDVWNIWKKMKATISGRYLFEEKDDKSNKKKGQKSNPWDKYR